jgi:hypothetical protein
MVRGAAGTETNSPVSPAAQEIMRAARQEAELKAKTAAREPEPSRDLAGPPHGLPTRMERERRQGAQERDIADRVWGRFPDVNPEQTMAFLGETLPDEMREFRVLAAERREEAVDFLTSLVRQSIELQAIKRRHPDLFAQHVTQRRLEHEAEEAAQAVRQSSGAARAQAVTGLRQKLESVFEVKQLLMQRDVEQMETELRDLKEMIEKRQQNRQAIVTRRLSELIGEANDLHW